MEKVIKDFWKYKSSKDNKCDYYFKYKKAGRVINDKASYILKQKNFYHINGIKKKEYSLFY